MSSQVVMKRLAHDWQHSHAAHAGDFADQPWGSQWGGKKTVALACSLVAPYAKDKHVLEIGCGGGKWTKALFDQCGAAAVTAIDVHTTALSESKKYEPRASYYLGDGETIPVAAGTGFDLVFTWGVLLHLPPGLVFRYLQESFRVSNSVVIQLPSLDTPAGRERFLVSVRRGRYRHPYELGYANFYTDDHIRTLLELARWVPTCLGHNTRDSIWLGMKLLP